MDEEETIASELVSFASTAWPVMLTCLFEILPGLASIVVVGHFCTKGKNVVLRRSRNRRQIHTNYRGIGRRCIGNNVFKYYWSFGWYGTGDCYGYSLYSSLRSEETETSRHLFPTRSLDSLHRTHSDHNHFTFIWFNPENVGTKRGSQCQSWSFCHTFHFVSTFPLRLRTPSENVASDEYYDAHAFCCGRVKHFQHWFLLLFGL